MNKPRLVRFAGATTIALLCTTITPASAALLRIEFDPANFTPGQPIDNPYSPFIPGTAFVYSAQTPDGCEVELMSVTADTKSDFPGEYSSIVATAVRDRSWLDAECSGNYVLQEDTIDWYAQDEQGNVWYMGEATTAWDDPAACPSTAGSWEAGVDGAEPGIVMLAEPAAGIAYQQEFLAGVAEDRARVLRVDARVSTEAGDYSHCVVTKEWSPLERGAVEQKSYCPSGGGLVLIKEFQGGIVRTELTGSKLPDGNYAQAGVCPG